jgi:redox-sensitive bicupin YhaK (pirin superfamily)
MTDIKMRKLETSLPGRETQDGAGVRLTRIFGQTLQQRLDPFLMLDYFRTDDPNDFIRGFPEHPHRGFETLTILLQGRMRHRDNRGHEGVIETGGAQWMLAGKGIIHSEMPEQDQGQLEGFQLWINLPSEEKMTDPRYQDLSTGDIPEIQMDRIRVRVIMGQFQEIKGPIQRPRTEPVVLDIILPQGERLTLPIEKRQRAALFITLGDLRVGDSLLPHRHLGVLSDDEEWVEIEALSDSRFLLIAGTPLREPIASYGPFVMNSPEEIHTAISDYQSGKFDR